jgi:hypothetical protein
MTRTATRIVRTVTFLVRLDMIAGVTLAATLFLFLTWR